MRRILIAGIALAAVLSGCGKPPAQTGPVGEMPVQAIIGLASQQPLEETIFLVGNLRARERIDIRSEIDARISRVGAHEGELVEAGQVLFVLDDAKLAAAVEEAQARFDLARQDFQRGEMLLERKTISLQQFDQFRTTLDATRAALRLAREQRNDATITAPFRGTIGERLVSPGQFVDRGELLSTLTQTDPLEIEFNVPERYIAQIREGETLALTTAAWPDERFQARIFFTAPAVDEASRTVLVKGRIDNADGRLKPGMFANLNLVFRARENAIVVPEQAISYRGNDAQLVVMNVDGRAEFRPVDVGLRLAGKAEITSGVTAGERVVIEGHQKMGPGVRITVAPESRQYGVEPELADSNAP